MAIRNEGARESLIGESANVYLPFLIGLLIALIAQPQRAAESGAETALLLVPIAAYLGLVALVGLVMWRRMCHHCDIGDEAESLQKRIDLYARIFDPLIMIGFAALVLFGGFDMLAATAVDPEIWSLYRLLLLAPLVAALCIRWTASYLSRRCLMNLANYRMGEANLPPARRSMGDYAAYLGFHFRVNILTLLVPFTVIMLVHDVALLVMGVTPDDTAFYAVMWVTILGLYVASPLILRLTWKTRRLKRVNGAMGDRLAAVGQRCGVRISEVFRWNTSGLTANACISGFGLPWRYVFMSDLLLDQMLPPQLEAVFGHEAGHARFHHLPVFLLAGLIVLSSFMLVEPHLIELAMPEWLGWGMELLIVAVYWVLLLAVLSPFLERQSDLLGAAAVRCPGNQDAYACHVHKPPAAVGAAGDARKNAPMAGGESWDLNHICPFQAWAFCSGMQRLAELNGISLEKRNMRHFSLSRRIDYIHSMTDRPDAVRRFHFRMKLVKLTMLGVAAVLIALMLAKAIECA